MDQAIVDQAASLLQAYGDDAIQCLKGFSASLEQRVVKESNVTPIEGLEAWKAQNTILQTMQMELETTDEDATKQALVRAATSALRWLARIELPPNAFDDNSSLQSIPEDSHHLVETLCQIMSQNPKDEALQEAVLDTLSKPSITRYLPPTNNMDELSSSASRIFFPTLQAMNWHDKNPTIVLCGMQVLQKVLSTSTISLPKAKSRLQDQAMTAIELTGGLAIFFSNFKQPPTPIPPKFKATLAGAMAALVLNHPENQKAFAQHAGLSAVLDALRLSYDVETQKTILHFLASLAYGAESKERLLAKGGLDAILTTMKDHEMEAGLQATGCRAIANVFAGTNDDLRTKGSLCVKPALRAMRMHPPLRSSNNNNKANDTGTSEESTINAQIHFYACAALRNLARLHHAILVDAGGITTILVTISEYHDRPAIQEQAWGILCHLMKGSIQNKTAIWTEGGLKLLLESSLAKFPKHARLQHHGLACLVCFAQSNQHWEDGRIQEEIISRKGLDIVLQALYLHKAHVEIARLSCEVMQHLTLVPDFATMVTLKNGTNLVLIALQKHPSAVGVQLAGLATLRNLATQATFDDTTLLAYGNDRTLLGVMLTCLEGHPKNPTIHAYAWDLLRRVVAAQPDVTITLGKMGAIPGLVKGMQGLVEAEGIPESSKLAAMEQGLLLLSEVSKDSDATLWMKQHQILEWLQTKVDPQLRRTSKAKPVVKALIQHLKASRIFLFRSGSARRRNG